MEKRICVKCGVLFIKTKSKGGRCKPCHAAYSVLWYKKNKKRILKKRRDRHLTVNYGITSETYESLVKKQKGLCVICQTSGQLLKGQHYTLHIDHNHKSGNVRGLLCNKCNGGIGLLGDSIQILKRAVKYLIERGSSE